MELGCDKVPSQLGRVAIGGRSRENNDDDDDDDDDDEDDEEEEEEEEEEDNDKDDSEDDAAVDEVREVSSCLASLSCPRRVLACGL